MYMMTKYIIPCWKIDLKNCNPVIIRSCASNAPRKSTIFSFQAFSGEMLIVWCHMGISINGKPKKQWFITENLFKMDDLGGSPMTQESSIYGIQQVCKMVEVLLRSLPNFHSGAEWPLLLRFDHPSWIWGEGALFSAMEQMCKGSSQWKMDENCDFPSSPKRNA